MAHLKVSIALAIAVGQLAATSVAQTLPARQDPQKSPPPAATVPAATRGSEVPVPPSSPAAAEAPVPTASSNSAGVVGTAMPPVPSAATASPAVASPESPSPMPPMTYSQPELPERNLLPVGVNQAQIPEATDTPRTYEHRFSGTLDVANVLWRSGRGYDLFSTNNAAWRIAIGVGYDLLKLPNQMILGLEVGAMAEPSHGPDSSSGLLGNTLSGTLSASTFLLGGSLRWAMAPWFAPYGRLAFFTSRIAVNIQSAAANATSSSLGGDWSYDRWAAGGALGGGLMFNLPPKSPVNVGLLVEGGYWLQQSIDIQLESSPPPGSISTLGARLGSLQNSGPYFRLAGMLRF